MIIRSQLGIVKPINRLSLNTFLISPIPKNPSNALKDLLWRNSMYDEYNVLVKNGTWLLIPRLACVNMVHSMWLFKHKFHADRTLSRYKARLVANGSSQQLGVDFDETFSSVVKPATIRTNLSLDVSRLPQVIVSFWVITYYLGPLNDSTLFHAPVPKLNTEVLLTLCVSVGYMSANHVQHQRTKHIEIDIHFVRDMVTARQVRVLHVPSHFQYADIFTKGLHSALFEEFRSNLSVRSPPSLTAGAY
nr:ribonuclease H-like domain-containing protein [Tanacetum cinerariifolium]